jgi:hypothetical protein
MGYIRSGTVIRSAAISMSENHANAERDRFVWIWAPLETMSAEALADGENWRHIDRPDDCDSINGSLLARTFTVPNGSRCQFTQLANTVKNHVSNDILLISAWETFGFLIESIADQFTLVLCRLACVFAMCSTVDFPESIK